MKDAVQAGFFPPSAPPAYSNSNNDFLTRALAHVPEELVADIKSGHQALSRLNMVGIKARVALVLDLSASMANPNNFIYTPVDACPLQKLINKAVSMALLFDDDGEVDVYPFGEVAGNKFKINKDNYKDAIAVGIANMPGQNLSTGTNYNAVVKEVREDYFKNSQHCDTVQRSGDDPVFCMFATDGQHNREENKATFQFTSSTYQAIFWKFICLKGTSERPNEFEYLQSFDDTSGVFESQCFIDNCDLVAVSTPERLTMEDLVNVIARVKDDFFQLSYKLSRWY